MTSNPTPDPDSTPETARRDRYATALARITVGHSAFIKVDVQAEYERAETVMAVADTELSELGEQLDEAGETIARQAAALAQASERAEFYEAAHARMRDRLEVARVRVRRAVAGSELAPAVETALAEDAAAVSSVVGQATRDRIADVAKPFFMNFSDEEAAKVNAGELADALAAVLLPTADRAAVLREAAEAVAGHPGPIPYRPQLDEDGGFWWDTRDRDAVATLLRRLADEAQQPEPHSCRNCEGVDPSTCLMNPDRPRSDGLKRAHVALAEQAGRDQSALDRVERLALTFEVSGNEFIAQQIRAAVGARRRDTETHVYLSTGCLHGQHEYCQNTEGVAGPKKPAQCKFCTTRCVCGCHAVGARQPDTQTGPSTPDTPRCGHCTHPKGDHSDRRDHRPSPTVPRRPWCHACNATCDYAASSAVPGRSAATDTHEETQA